jgi:hypothetical protein
MRDGVAAGADFVAAADGDPYGITWEHQLRAGA